MKSQIANISIDDDTLVRQCINGDNAAMDTLIRKYQNRIYNVILKICANPEDAADLTQETFVKVIQNIDRFRRKSGFYTWAFRIAVNLALSYCKRNAKIAFRSLDADSDSQTAEAVKALKHLLQEPAAIDPAAIAQKNELCDIVLKTLMKLDDDQRAVIVLRDIEGMNYAQIARVLQVELGTVKSRLSRARANLRDMLEVWTS